MRSLTEERQEVTPSWKVMATASGYAIGFIICSVVFAKVGYTVVSFILHGATHAVQVSWY